MKVHYINILLFALPLNILEHNKNEPHTTPNHTQTTRSLCECDIYTSIYDNDPQMKAVMENYNRQTSDRFKEYDERMKTTRQKCKDKCDKEIQKIVLKDKMEKQMAQQLTTLETKITTEDIPTCICEKSLADKTEKFCLNCGVNVGGGVTLSSGVLGGIGAVAVNAWKDAAIIAAKEAAIAKGAAAGKIAGEAKGVDVVIYYLKGLGVEELIPRISESIGKTIPYTNAGKISDIIYGKYTTTCMGLNNRGPPAACNSFNIKFGLFNTRGKPIGSPPSSAIPTKVREAVDKATRSAKAAAEAKSTTVTAEITEKQTALIEAGFNSSITSINASIIAILIIVLIMVIIYLILRYRRKKKMKKKLQYIKLLEE
ncbi:rifin [Plasmodium falciparum NF54]|uniref:Rifin n=2 Tax=Plasmodium falciparum TaxID=5833 RepID=Q8I0E0_PLAF7|nr:rifin [Plasmodium falciparum 3D7]KAF4327157.1 rifin [Plasmodium falciparum NF54]PKC48261.1 rifin [Plasmodium falciparum NF54]CZT99167.1 rifin [Plasmodium falciparum 3D7]|eukprot:XP_001350414.1 rifin [Plasmodium falciparum 3D7]